MLANAESLGRRDLDEHFPEKMLRDAHLRTYRNREETLTARRLSSFIYRSACASLYREDVIVR
jgi:hypothetical protein